MSIKENPDGTDSYYEFPREIDTDAHLPVTKEDQNSEPFILPPEFENDSSDIATLEAEPIGFMGQGHEDIADMTAEERFPYTKEQFDKFIHAHPEIGNDPNFLIATGEFSDDEEIREAVRKLNQTYGKHGDLIINPIPNTHYFDDNKRCITITEMLVNKEGDKSYSFIYSTIR